MEPNTRAPRKSQKPTAASRIESSRRICRSTLSPRQHPQKLTPVHAILECLAPIDENYRHLIRVLLSQLRVGIDVHFAPLEVGLALDLRERLLNHVAEMTSLARIHHHVVHMTIVNANVCSTVNCSAQVAFQFAFLPDKSSLNHGTHYDEEEPSEGTRFLGIASSSTLPRYSCKSLRFQCGVEKCVAIRTKLRPQGNFASSKPFRRC